MKNSRDSSQWNINTFISKIHFCLDIGLALHTKSKNAMFSRSSKFFTLVKKQNTSGWTTGIQNDLSSFFGKCLGESSKAYLSLVCICFFCLVTKFENFHSFHPKAWAHVLSKYVCISMWPPLNLWVFLLTLTVASFVTPSSLEKKKKHTCCATSPNYL